MKDCKMMGAENCIQWTEFKTAFPITVHSFTRRNLFILNKFLISGKILIACRELYFEVVGHVYLIRMGYFPENEVITVKDHVQNDTYSL